LANRFTYTGNCSAGIQNYLPLRPGQQKRQKFRAVLRYSNDLVGHARFYYS
jgi:hypothetical protein